MRIAGSNGRTTQRALRKAAIELISQHGYHGISLRMLADHVGLQAGSLYNHIKSKQDLLFMLLRSIQEDLIRNADDKLEPVRGTLPRLCVFVKQHIEFHTMRKAEVFIGNMELRSLAPENYAVIIGLRKKYEMMLRDIVQAGIDECIFSVPEAKITSFAILGMINGVSNWYQPKGGFTIAELEDRYTEMVLDLLRTSDEIRSRFMARQS